jgi:uncharacterized membrane protein
MSLSVAIAVHAIAAAVWVGGMFFAHMALRPAAARLLEPAQRLPLWAATFARFFPWVWASVLTLLVSGYWGVFAGLGGMAGARLHVHLMQGVGLLMMGLFAFVYFAPYRRLREAVAVGAWEQGGRQLARIRRVVGVNLVLGLVTVAVGSGGRFL